MTRWRKTMKKTEVEFFGKLYRWVKVEGQLQLKPDLQFDMLFSNAAGRMYQGYLKGDEHISASLEKLQTDYYRQALKRTK